MKTKSRGLPLLIGALVIPFAVSLAYATLVARPGEVILDAGQTKTILRSNVDRSYRICLQQVEPKGLVTVTEDRDKEIRLYPGDCENFEARNLSVTAGEDLPPGEGLIVRYSLLG